jgi:hypothetical protein
MAQYMLEKVQEFDNGQPLSVGPCVLGDGKIEEFGNMVDGNVHKMSPSLSAMDLSV